MMQKLVEDIYLGNICNAGLVCIPGRLQAEPVVIVDAAMQVLGYLQLPDYSTALPKFKCDALSLFATPGNQLLPACSSNEDLR